MDLIYVCWCENQVRVTPDDRLSICPHCGRAAKLLSGNADAIKSTNKGDRINYVFSISGETVRLNLAPSGFRPQTVLMFVWIGKKLVGVADADRKLWFPVEQESITILRAIQVLSAFAFVGALYALSGMSIATGIILGLLLVLPVLTPDKEEFELGWDLE